MKRVAIIGTGLSGLSVAHLLSTRAEIILFERARGVGGRISTRRAAPYFFDHASQYFKVKSRSFKHFISPLIDSGIIKRWNARYVKFDSNKITERKNWIDDEPRYVGVPGMNSIALYLAKSLKIYLNTTIVSIQKKRKWELIDETGNIFDNFDWVISTVPAPQVSELMPNSFLYSKEIKSIKMKPGYSLMLGFKNDLSLNFDAAQVLNSDISWIAVNSQKPGRAGPFTLMINASEKFSEAHIFAEKPEVMKRLIVETSYVIGHDLSSADYKTVHGWRYANVAKVEKQPIFVDEVKKLAVCGDWCCGGMVEGAFTSANNLVSKLKENELSCL